MSRASRLRATQKRKGKKGGPGKTLSAGRPTPQQQADATVRALTEAMRAQGVQVNVKRERRQQKR